MAFPTYFPQIIHKLLIKSSLIFSYQLCANSVGFSTNNPLKECNFNLSEIQLSGRYNKSSIYLC